MAQKPKRKGWTIAKYRLNRRGAIGLLKLLKFMRTTWADGAPFLSSEEHDEVVALECNLRDVLGRGTGQNQLQHADELVVDYIEIFMRKSKQRRPPYRGHDADENIF